MAWTILQRQDMAVRAKYHHTVRRDAVIERHDGSHWHQCARHTGLQVSIRWSCLVSVMQTVTVF